MSTEVVLWSDYVSPYAFVAKAWAYELERDYDIVLQWRPYTLDVASYMGSVDGRDPHHWRRVRYSYMDARRYANKQGLVLKGPLKIYYARPANAGMLYAQRHGVFRAYNDAAFDRFWRREFDPEDIAAVEALLIQAGAPAGFTNAVGLGAGATYFALYPGGGIEAFAGPIGVRAEVGDNIFFNNGMHNNLRVSFGPQFRF